MPAPGPVRQERGGRAAKLLRMAAVLSPASDRDPAPGAAPRPDAELFIVMNRGSGAAEKDAVREAIAAELQRAGRAHRFVPVASGEIVQACRDAARLASEH